MPSSFENPSAAGTDRRKRLRSGFTTGAAAAAAAGAALCLLLEGKAPAAITIRMLSGEHLSIPIHRSDLEGDMAWATVIKDAGDDPDVTNGAEIGARVRLPDKSGRRGDPSLPEMPQIEITGAEGVGRVTLPGLEVPPGNPAINPGPVRMIRETIREVLLRHGIEVGVQVSVFVPEGERLSRKTLNARLGILGGISILGTTGWVRPMSHEAFTASIDAALSVARAAGCSRVVFSTGRRSERAAQAVFASLPPVAFVQIGDFFHHSLRTAARMGFSEITLAVFFGKAVKMAMNIPHTHARNAEMPLAALAQWTRDKTGDESLAEVVGRSNTAREALGLLWPDHPAVIADVGRRMIESARTVVQGLPILISGILFDFSGSPLFQQ